MGTISTDPVGKGKIDAFESDFNKLAERTGCSMDSSTTPRQNGQQPRDHYVQGRHYPDRYPLYMFTVVREYPSNQQEYEDTHNIYSKVHYLILLYSPFPATRKKKFAPLRMRRHRWASLLPSKHKTDNSVTQYHRRHHSYPPVEKIPPLQYHHFVTFQVGPPHSVRTSARILRLCLISAATRLIYCE